MLKKFNPRFTLLLVMIVSTGLLRLLSVRYGGALFNFTPIGALALFGGAYFTQKWKAVLFPLLVLFSSDLVIQRFIYVGTFGSVFYDGWYITYAVFVLIVFGGGLIIKRVGFKSVLLAGIAASLGHYLITDFFCWMGSCINVTPGLPYTRDLRGLFDCYVLALLFLQRFFLGTVFYSALLFGAFEFAQWKFPVLKPVSGS